MTESDVDKYRFELVWVWNVDHKEAEQRHLIHILPCESIFQYGAYKADINNLSYYLNASVFKP